MTLLGIVELEVLIPCTLASLMAIRRHDLSRRIESQAGDAIYRLPLTAGLGGATMTEVAVGRRPPSCRLALGYSDRSGLIAG